MNKTHNSTNEAEEESDWSWLYDSDKSEYSNVTCEDNISIPLFVHYSLIPSVVFILVLSFFERHRCRSKLDEMKCLKGRFGFVVPLDYIGAFNGRWTYGFASGAIANTIILLFREEFLPPGIPRWAKGIGLLAGALEVGLSYFPIFACLNTRHKTVGPIIGFFYTLFWASITVADIVICPHETEYKQYEKVISHWPSVLCLLFLLCRNVHIFIFRNRAEVDGNKEQNVFLAEHQANYIKRLLRKPEDIQLSWFQRKIYTWDPYFKFPNRIIGTSVLSLFCLYIFITSEFNGFKRILNSLKDLDKALQQIGMTLQDIIEALQGVWFFTTILSCLTSIFYVFHILSCYRKQLKYLWTGDKRFLPNSFHEPHPSQSIIAIAKYSSCQVAYILWGYTIMHILQIVIGMIFVFVVVFPIKAGTFWEILQDLLVSLIIPFSIVFLLLFLQTRFATLFFLQKKLSPGDKEKPLALNNRKAFQNFNYFFFFNNVIVGLGSCLSRLMRSLFVGSWLIARIDRTILPSGFESMDSGYKTWVGMLYVDHYHSNPTLIGFCYVLLKSRKKALNEITECDSITLTDHKISTRAKTRWFLFYSLVRNPSLIKYRKQKQADYYT